MGVLLEFNDNGGTELESGLEGYFTPSFTTGACFSNFVCSVTSRDAVAVGHLDQDDGLIIWVFVSDDAALDHFRYQYYIK